MNRRAWCAVWAATLAMPAAATQPADGRRLLHDPFSRVPARSSPGQVANVPAGAAPAWANAASVAANAAFTPTSASAAAVPASATAASASHPGALSVAAAASTGSLPGTAQPAGSTEVEPARLPVLRALLRTASRPMVNVDGTLLEVGDSFEGLRLVEIGEYGARFVRDGKPVELRLGQGGAR